MAIDDFDLRYRLENNVFTVQQLNGKVAQGTFTANGSVDLGRKVPAYTSRLNLQGIQADPLVKAFFPQAAGTVFGTMNLQAALEGEGIEKAMLEKNLSGQGDVLLTDGQLTGAGLVQGLAEFLNLEELRVLRFSKATGNFSVRQGKVLVKSDVNGKDVRLQPQGTVGLNGGLDLALNLQVSPALAKRIGSSQITQLLSSQQGWTQIPVKVGGTVNAPRFYLDTAALGKKIQEKAGEEIRGKLQKELEKHLPSGSGGTGKQPPRLRP